VGTLLCSGLRRRRYAWTWRLAQARVKF